MPKEIEFKSPWGHSGIEICFTPSARRIDVSGWYDDCAHIEGGSMTLAEFFRELGITPKICMQAFNDGPRKQTNNR